MTRLHTAAALMMVATFASAGNTTFEDYATVVTSQPEYSVGPDREDCVKTTRPRTSQSTSERGLSGPIIGGLVGGLLGNTVGKGSGRKAAVGIGAISGVIVGDRMQNSSTSSDEVLKCRLIPGEKTITGYAVTLSYNGRTITTWNNEMMIPGRQVPVGVNVTLLPNNHRDSDRSFRDNDRNSEFYYKQAN